MSKRVLIVDDAVVMRMMIKGILSKNGFEVVGEAQNGVEAVDKYTVRFVNRVPDVTMEGRIASGASEIISNNQKNPAPAAIQIRRLLRRTSMKTRRIRSVLRIEIVKAIGVLNLPRWA